MRSSLLAVLLNCNANLTIASIHDTVESISCPKGSTALHLAASAGNTGIARQLLLAFVSDVRCPAQQ